MTKYQALQVLGCPADAGPEMIKKSYRRLILEVHPDTGKEADWPYTVQEINEAYSCLVKHRPNNTDVNTLDQEQNKADANTMDREQDRADANTMDREQDSESRRQNENRYLHWSAPICERVWCERDILEKMTDEDGETVGIFTAARGRYLYSPEEEFPLFLKSLYRCSGEILEKADRECGCLCDPERRNHFRAELLYLLAAQFVDPAPLLEEVAEVSLPADGKKQYKAAAMLEQRDGDRRRLTEETVLIPECVKQHRLYLMDEKGIDRGYVSFLDDRLYYCLIPLFEQRRLQVKIRVGKPAVYGRKKCCGLEMTVRFHGEAAALPENLNLKIEALLRKYRGER